MRWVKHLTMARKDKALSAVIEDVGLEGYGLYWMLIEEIANDTRSNVSPPYLAQSEKQWSKLMKCSSRRFARIKNSLVRNQVIFCEQDGSDLGIGIPGIQIREDHGRPPAHIWAVIRLDVFKRDQYTCKYCGVRTEDPDCDHILPASRGGSSEMENLATACYPCNRSKGDKTPAEWRSDIQ